MKRTKISLNAFGVLSALLLSVPASAFQARPVQAFTAAAVTNPAGVSPLWRDRGNIRNSGLRRGVGIHFFHDSIGGRGEIRTHGSR